MTSQSILTKRRGGCPNDTADNEQRRAPSQGMAMETMHAVQGKLRPLKKAPPLVDACGTGIGLYGFFSPPGFSPLAFTMLWVSFFGLPIVPIATYLVKAMGNETYQFYGKLAFLDFARIYGRKGVALLLCSVLLSALAKCLMSVLTLMLAIGLALLQSGI
jgi:hypothetical protein